MSEAEPSAPAPPEGSRPSLGDPPGSILPTDTLATAGRKAMWVHVDRLLAREDALRDPDRTDDLKRYRVATRRLRAAIRLFGPAYPRKRLERLREGLTSVARAVGGVRDLDVRIADARAWAAARSPEDAEAIVPLTSAWTAERTSLAADLIERIDSRRHRRWLADLAAFVVEAEEPVQDRGHAPTTVRDRTASRVWDAYERLRAFEPLMSGADTTILHEIRIEAKRLRYTLEFLGDVLGPDRPWLVESLVTLQDHLGALNDAVVTSAAVRAFLERHHEELAPAEAATITAYLADQEHAIDALGETAGGPWRTVARVTFARRLARSVLVA